MLTLSRKQMTILFLVLVSFIAALVVSGAIIHAVNPTWWKHISDALPDVVNHY